jgi:hypothetical protein
VGIWLEDMIKDAILDVRFRRSGEGIHPEYFVDALDERLQFEDSAAAFLARFITDRIVEDRANLPESPERELDRYSAEVIASYLEDQGYIVSGPD